MATTLEGGGRKDRITDKGHGTSALGPSDTSDSGSDIVGGPGTFEGDVIGLDRGTNEDADTSTRGTAGADIGDSNLDSDSDSVGTGEHVSAGRDPRIRRDIGTDHVDSIAETAGLTDVPTGGERSGLSTDKGGGSTGSGRGGGGKPV